MLILYAFMLPQSSRRRLFLGSLALFMDLMLLMLVGYELGFDSNHNTPYAVKCLSINIIMVSLFIIISIFGSRYIAKSTSQAPLWVQGLVKNGFVGKFLLIQVSSKELADIDSEMAKLNIQSQSSTGTTEMDQRSSDWILLTAILDRLFLIIYTISFIIYHS
uniref:Uncharacterized protein n=2 Tax=Tetranychus urticae TaxID=32264 RepID=T1KZ41_TETUR